MLTPPAEKKEAGPVDGSVFLNAIYSSRHRKKEHHQSPPRDLVQRIIWLAIKSPTQLPQAFAAQKPRIGVDTRSHRAYTGNLEVLFWDTTPRKQLSAASGLNFQNHNGTTLEDTFVSSLDGHFDIIWHSSHLWRARWTDSRSPEWWEPQATYWLRLYSAGGRPRMTKIREL